MTSSASGGPALDDRSLRAQLSLFEKTASSLEAAYAELREHADRVDVKLAETNSELIQSKAQLDAVFDSLPLAVFRSRGDGHEALNAPASELLISHGRVPSVRMAGDAPTRIRERGRDGVERSFELREIPCAATNLLLVEDRSQWAALERLSGLAELALGIAHEVRNPLNGLAGFASLLRRDPSSAKAPRWAARIEEGARRLEQTVRALLDFARPDCASPTTILSLGSCFRVAREEISLELEPGLSELSIVGDRCSLEQAIANLARNSREAGASRLSVTRLSSNESRVLLELRDDGPGIDAAIAERIFDPFIGSKESSSGLGLAFASRVFARLGASIRLSRAPGQQGAGFELDLPLAEES